MHLLAQVTKPIVQPSIFGFGSTTKMRQTLTPPQESLDLSLTRVCLSQTIRGGPQHKPEFPSHPQRLALRGELKRKTGDPNQKNTGIRGTLTR